MTHSGNNTTASRWKYAAVMTTALAALLVPAICYLPQESLWVDETTQLSGLTLGPVGVVRWLSGGANPFPVPADRMPPLSYWAGMAWAQVFGLSETSLRGLGVVYAATAVLIVVAAARRAFGLKAALAAGLLFGLSPNVIVQSVNIRAYPLFMLLAACAFYCLVRLLGDSGSKARWSAGLAASLVLAMYTHFFGVVLAGSLLGAWLAVLVRGGRPLRQVWAVIAAVGLGALGLAPFVKAAMGVSEGVVAGAGSRDQLYALGRLAFRMFAHPATSVSAAATAAACAGFAGLAVSSLRKAWSSTVAAAILVALALGGLAVVAAAVLVPQFDSTTPPYSIWMLPGLSIVLAGGFAAERQPWRAAALVGGVLLIAANGWGAARLASDGAWFAHVRHPEVARLIHELGDDRVAVVHDAGSTAWGHVYFPLRYTFQNRPPQYVVEGDGTTGVRVALLPERRPVVDALSLPVHTLVVLQSRNLGARELAEQLRSGPQPFPDGPAASALLKSDRWRPTRKLVLPAFIKTDVSVFQRKE